MCKAPWPRLGKARWRGGSRGTTTREPLANPPIRASWNIWRTGTSHLKGVQQRADTTQRIVAAGLTILGTECTSVRGGGAAEAAHNSGWVSAVWSAGLQKLTGRKMLSCRQYFSGVWRGSVALLSRLCAAVQIGFASHAYLKMWADVSSRGR